MNVAKRAALVAIAALAVAGSRTQAEVWISGPGPQPSEDSHTSVDCRAWDDAEWIPFVAERPFRSLKVAVERSVEYANAHTGWLAPDGKVLEIRARSGCSFDNFGNPIALSFFPERPDPGSQYGSGASPRTLLIRSSEDGKPFGIANSYFDDSGNGTWNVVFRNADFVSGSPQVWGAFFQTNSTGGIRIESSAMTVRGPINHEKVLSATCTGWSWFGFSCVQISYVYASSNFVIDRSFLELVGNGGDFVFKSPGIVRNSKIVLRMPAWSGRLVVSRSNSAYDLLQSVSVDLAGNGLHVASDSINARYSAVTAFSADGGSQVFLNNLVASPIPHSANGWYNAYNNAFSGWFSDDSGDPRNLHRNLTAPRPTSGISWEYRKFPGHFLGTDLSDVSLYAEAHPWTQSPENLSPYFRSFR